MLWTFLSQQGHSRLALQIHTLCVNFQHCKNMYYNVQVHVEGARLRHWQRGKWLKRPMVGTHISIRRTLKYAAGKCIVCPTGNKFYNTCSILIIAGWDNFSVEVDQKTVHIHSLKKQLQVLVKMGRAFVIYVYCGGTKNFELEISFNPQKDLNLAATLWAPAI